MDALASLDEQIESAAREVDALAEQIETRHRTLSRLLEMRIAALMREVFPAGGILRVDMQPNGDGYDLLLHGVTSRSGVPIGGVVPRLAARRETLISDVCALAALRSVNRLWSDEVTQLFPF